MSDEYKWKAVYESAQGVVSDLFKQWIGAKIGTYKNGLTKTTYKNDVGGLPFPGYAIDQSDFFGIWKSLDIILANQICINA